MAWWTINRMWPCLMLTIDDDNEHDIGDDDDGDDGDYDFNSFHNSGYIDLASPAKKCLR